MYVPLYLQAYLVLLSFEDTVYLQIESLWQPCTIRWWLAFFSNKLVFKLRYLCFLFSLHGSQPCRGEGACLTQWIYESGAAQDRQVIVKSSDKSWSTRGGNGNLLQYSCCKNPINSMKRQKDNDTRRWAPLRSESIQCGTGMRKLDNISGSMDMNLSKFWEIVEGRGAWCAAVHRVAKSQTWLSAWTTKTSIVFKT